MPAAYGNRVTLRASGGPTFALVTPFLRMPDSPALARAAAVAEVNNALCVARCAAQLAGLEEDPFVVRELLHLSTEQIDRAARVIRELLTRAVTLPSH